MQQRKLVFAIAFALYGGIASSGASAYTAMVPVEAISAARPTAHANTRVNRPVQLAYPGVPLELFHRITGDECTNPEAKECESGVRPLTQEEVFVLLGASMDPNNLCSTKCGGDRHGPTVTVTATIPPTPWPPTHTEEPPRPPGGHHGGGGGGGDDDGSCPSTLTSASSNAAAAASGSSDSDSCSLVVSLSDLPKEPVSEELECAWKQYINPLVDGSVGPPPAETLPRGLMRVHGYAYSNGQEFKFTMAPVDPEKLFGSGWEPTWGKTDMPGTGPSYLFEPAFHEHSGYLANLEIPPLLPGPPNAGPVYGASAFETSLFVGVHEIAHQAGFLDEEVASWFGWEAVLNYREDGGSKCE